MRVSGSERGPAYPAQSPLRDPARTNFTPEEVHQSKQTIKPEKLWRNYYQKKATIVNPF